VPCWCGWQTIGSAPDENRFTVCEQAKRVNYGAVFKAKKEIPAKSLRVTMFIVFESKKEDLGSDEGGQACTGANS
jgi:hypothetical protein